MTVRARIELLRRQCVNLPTRLVPVRVWLPRKAGDEPAGMYPMFGGRAVRVVYELHVDAKTP